MWTAASRRQVRVLHGHNSDDVYVGPHVQVSRLGNPLFNEVIVPMSKKDLWNSLPPTEDKSFAEFVEQPELAALLPVLYPGVFDNLASSTRPRRPRADLVAVLLTGIPEGLIDGFKNNTGEIQADMLRLNTDIKPSKKRTRSACSAATWPASRTAGGCRRRGVHLAAGRRRRDVRRWWTRTSSRTTRSPLVEQGLSADDVSAKLLDFPYLGIPYDGFNNP